MGDVFYRIDDRLIHGQVVTSWSQHYHLEQIIIVDDGVANDPVQKQIISMVAPSNIKVTIKSIEESISLITKAEENKVKTLILVKGPDVLASLADNNIGIDKVIVGGIQFKKGKESITKTVSIFPEEANHFYKLADFGTELIYQVVPGDKIRDFIPKLEQVYSRGEV